MTDIRRKVIDTIYGVCKPERPDLSDHDKPLLAGDLDSLDFASVMMALEDEYGITFGDEDTEKLGSINQIVDFIEKRDGA
jgi:acyl carrier protein